LEYDLFENEASIEKIVKKIAYVLNGANSLRK